jgi:hypothetical protein
VAVSDGMSIAVKDSTVSLDRVPPGMPVVVRAAGYVPRCVAAPTNGGDLRIGLERESPHAWTLVPSSVNRGPLGFLRGTLDACAIPLRYFSLSKVTQPHPQTITLSGATSEHMLLVDKSGERVPLGQPGNHLRLSPVPCAPCAADYPANIRVR